MKYKVFGIDRGDSQKRCRKLLIEVCDFMNVLIVKGVVPKDHNPMHIKYRPSLDIIRLVKKLKGRSIKKNLIRINFDTKEVFV